MTVKPSQHEDSCFIISAEVENNTGGAFVNVYSTAADEQSALRAAILEIEDAGWSIRDRPRISSVARKDFEANGVDGLEYFEQALVDEIVLVFHTYPKALQ